jgi:hypothetical protein
MLLTGEDVCSLQTFLNYVQYREQVFSITYIQKVRTASVIRAMMMEAVRTSETSVHFNVTTRRYIPEDSKLHTRRRENLKSHIETWPLNRTLPEIKPTFQYNFTGINTVYFLS